MGKTADVLTEQDKIFHLAILEIGYLFEPPEGHAGMLTLEYYRFLQATDHALFIEAWRLRNKAADIRNSDGDVDELIAALLAWQAVERRGGAAYGRHLQGSKARTPGAELAPRFLAAGAAKHSWFLDRRNLAVRKLSAWAAALDGYSPDFTPDALAAWLAKEHPGPAEKLAAFESRMEELLGGPNTPESRKEFEDHVRKWSEGIQWAVREFCLSRKAAT